MHNYRQHNLNDTYEARLKKRLKVLGWQSLHLDPWLLAGVLILATLGIIILASASNESTTLLTNQLMRFGLGFFMMLIFAQISPLRYQQWAPWIYAIGLALLIMVLLMGRIGQGAQRWLNLGIISIQPSELMKLATPIFLAYYLNDKKLPPSYSTLAICGLSLLVPVVLTLKQPDLGTAILIAASGFFVVFLAGLSWRLLLSLVTFAGLSAPILWHFMHGYQRQRVLTFLNPERDPLGTGYHIIQSKIALGSGGLLGKGWLQGTQSHLHFLPAHTTDFIFAVSGEEFGLIGTLSILCVFIAIFLRCFYISLHGQDTFSRLLAGSLSLMFITSGLINIGMVIGILPVVGVPLPMISYGGSSLLTLLIGFGIIMSIQTHRKLWTS